jgi:hypothetical protein
MARKSPAPGEGDAVRWRREAERLRPLEDALPILGIPEVAQFLGTLGIVWHIAHHGFSRSESTTGGGLASVDYSGGPKQAWHDPDGTTQIARVKTAESKPPAYNPQAMALWRGELRRLVAGERTLIGKADSIVNGEKQPSSTPKAA